MKTEDPARKDTPLGRFFERKPNPKQSGMGGYLYLALIGLALALMGGLFVFFLGRGYLRAKETREWENVPAVVMVSQIGERQLGREVPKEFTHELVYEYEFKGNFYRGDRLKRRKNPYFKEAGKIAPEVERWPVGKKIEAWVNPADPAEAVLEHETKAPGYSIWFPALFLVGGLVVFVRALTKMLGRAKS